MEYKTLLSADQLSTRIKEISAEINNDYQNKELVIVGILKGSFIFLADLVRNLNVPLEIEFMGVSSYVGTSSTGEVRITSDLYSEIQGKHVLLVEDIIDKGITIDYLLAALMARKPADLKVCTLLSKPKAHIMKFDIDYVGFEIENEFVIGYGLDLDGRYRELPYIAQITGTHSI